MSFEKVTSTITIVPFTTEYLKDCYKYETDKDVKELIKDKIETNPISYRLNKLANYDKKHIIGYYDEELVMLKECYYTDLISKFIKDELLRKSRHYRRFVLFNGDESNSKINSIMADLVRQDIFEIESIDIYRYAIFSAVEKPLYISYVSSFDTD
jgi:hypothetical protein